MTTSSRPRSIPKPSPDRDSADEALDASHPSDINTFRQLIVKTALADSVAPVMAAGSRAARSGARAASTVAAKTAKTVTQAESSDRVNGALEDLVSVITVQQSLIDELRHRVALLEQR